MNHFDKIDIRVFDRFIDKFADRYIKLNNGQRFLVALMLNCYNKQNQSDAIST